MNLIKLREIANCDKCKRDEYCQRLKFNKQIIRSVEKEGKCPDFEG
jgi:hypothetical protein